MKHPASKRYARAFLEIGIELSNHKALQGQLRELDDLFVKSPEFRAVVSNPSIRIEERRATLRAIGQSSGWNPMMINLALLLVDKDRMKYVGDIADELDRLVDLHDGNVRATVSTATKLESAQIESIKSALTAMTGKKVILTTEIDPLLIGGVTTRIGDTILDGSVRTQLNTLSSTSSRH